MNEKYEEKMAEEIRVGLKKAGVSQPAFCKSFLNDYYGDSIDEIEQDKHYERFKKVLALKSKPEMIALYYHYYKTKYLNVVTISNESKCAAYELYIELDTRIASQPLVNGRDKAALESLYQLFQKWREISKGKGCDSQKFYEYSKKYMNDVLRPFLSEWHSKEEGEDTGFREDLESLQVKTTEYIEQLKHEFNFSAK